MKVTSLIYKNNRMQVFFDGAYAFSCNERFIIDKKLYTGSEVTEEEYVVLVNEAHYTILQLKMYEYAIRGRYSARELFTKVKSYAYKKFDFTPEDSFLQASLDKLIDQRIFNNDSLIRNWINAYIERGKGGQFIFSKLMQKGFAKDDIENGLGAMDLLAAQTKLEEILEKKLASLESREPDRYKLKQKLLQFGVRRGYGFGEVNDVLKKLMS